MTAAELLADLSAAGVVLTAHGDCLAYDAPRGALTPALLGELKARKAELLALLGKPVGEPADTKPTPKPTEGPGVAPAARAKGWTINKAGELITRDGTVYARTTAGGWLLVKHPRYRMADVGTFALDAKGDPIKLDGVQ